MGNGNRIPNAMNGTRPAGTISESRRHATWLRATAMILGEGTARERPVNRPGIRP
jgi:hypothetical protein